MTSTSSVRTDLQTLDIPDIVTAGRSFGVKPLGDLAPRDRALFQVCGQGPVVRVSDPFVHHAIARHIAAAPHAVAAEHQGESITYGELGCESDHVAARLVREGVRPGDHVGLFVRRSIPMLVGLLGILKAGAAYVPQDVGLAPASQLDHVVRTAGTRGILTVSEYADRVPVPPGHRLICVDKPLPDDGPVGRQGRPPRPDDGCYILFTSGTTGRPNGVKVTHRNVGNVLLTEPGGLGVRPGDRVAQLLNVAFDMAAWEILGCLSHGGTLLARRRGARSVILRAMAVIALRMPGLRDSWFCPRLQ
jgi:D-alanine--poly(phosphoribitol) ligase subunit 1